MYVRMYVRTYVCMYVCVYIYIHMGSYGYGSKNGYGSFRGDPDVWNERVKYKRFDTDLLRRYTLKWHGISTIRHFLVRIKGMRGSCPLEMYGSWVWIGAMDRLWVTTSRKDQHDSLFPASEQVRVTHQSVKATDN